MLFVSLEINNKYNVMDFTMILIDNFGALQSMDFVIKAQAKIFILFQDIIF